MVLSYLPLMDDLRQCLHLAKVKGVEQCVLSSCRTFGNMLIVWLGQLTETTSTLTVFARATVVRCMRNKLVKDVRNPLHFNESCTTWAGV